MNEEDGNKRYERLVQSGLDLGLSLEEVLEIISDLPKGMSIKKYVEQKQAFLRRFGVFDRRNIRSQSESPDNE